MIRYPSLNEGTTLGVTAPSSGVKAELHDLIHLSFNRMEMEGFKVVGGETVWTQHKAKSAPAKVRAMELDKMMRDDQIGMIIPPWGANF